MRARRLRTDYLDRPLGIDLRRPRLSWVCDGGLRQTAYRIVAERDGRQIWDTGKVESPRTTHIEYGGPALRSRDRVTWSVTLWDETDTPGDQESSWFEMGLLEPSDWAATWITADRKPAKHRRYPVDCFRRTFTLSRPVVSARLYLTACGLYEARLGGEKVGDAVLTPGATDYRHRLQYQSYDVTSLVREGQNTLDIDLADGWRDRDPEQHRGRGTAAGRHQARGQRRTPRLHCLTPLTKLVLTPLSKAAARPETRGARPLDRPNFKC